MNGLSFISSLSLIAENPAVSTQPDHLSTMIMSQIQDFIYMDCLMTDQWFDKWIVPQNFSDNPLSNSFKENGYDSSSLIINLGSSFIYMIIIVSGLLV
jgi:hypothetical protein